MPPFVGTVKYGAEVYISSESFKFDTFESINDGQLNFTGHEIDHVYINYRKDEEEIKANAEKYLSEVPLSEDFASKLEEIRKLQISHSEELERWIVVQKEKIKKIEQEIAEHEALIKIMDIRELVEMEISKRVTRLKHCIENKNRARNLLNVLNLSPSAVSMILANMYLKETSKIPDIHDFGLSPEVAREIFKVLCRICLESNEKPHAFTRCGHVVCENCANQLIDKCPFCNLDSDIIRLFYSRGE